MLKTNLRVYKTVEGETIEQKMERIINNNEPIKDGAELRFSERSAGVNPAADVRTDRFDMAIDMADKGAADQIAKRKMSVVKDEEVTKGEKADGDTSPDAAGDTK